MTRQMGNSQAGQQSSKTRKCIKSRLAVANVRFEAVATVLPRLTESVVGRSFRVAKASSRITGWADTESICVRKYWRDQLFARCL